MNNRRSFLKILAAVSALPLAARARSGDEVINYKSPACGCCGQWEKHIRANGFLLQTRMVDDMDLIKRKYGVRRDLLSCHTAIIGGYVIEGHVPAADIRRLLRERPKAIGLAVPGMPASAPGMDQQPPQPYEVLAFDAGRSWLFQSH